MEATRKLLEQGVFAVLGNVGTPTAKVSLPVLAEDGAPAVGFFTGAGLLRPGVGEVVNFRASYVQETAAVIRAAIQSGVPASGICAFVQNDAYGMAGVGGIKRALAAEEGARASSRSSPSKAWIHRETVLALWASTNATRSYPGRGMPR